MTKDETNNSSPDPFDLEALRQPQDFQGLAGVQKTLKAKVRKPSKEWWFQVHPDPEFSVNGYVIDLKEENELYWVVPSIAPELVDEPTFGKRAFFTYVTRQGEYFLWPIRLPDETGKLDDWNRSALEYAQQHNIWQRVASNKHAGEYDQFLTEASWSDPVWPDCSFQELLRLGFKGRIIDSISHPVIKQLRGENV